jgi:hypothetical protein
MVQRSSRQRCIYRQSVLHLVDHVEAQLQSRSSIIGSIVNSRAVLMLAEASNANASITQCLGRKDKAAARQI